MHDFAETTQGYQLLADDDERDLYKNNVWEMLLASGMMFNSHRERYQSRIDAMNSQFMVAHMDYSQRMTYPMTLHNATETLNRHKPDNRKSKFVKNVSTRSSDGNRNASNGSSGETGNVNLAQGGQTTGACVGKNTEPREFVSVEETTSVVDKTVSWADVVKGKSKAT